VELTAKHGVVQEDVFRRGGHAEGIDNVVYDIASMAHDHVRTARGMLEPVGGKAPAEVWPIFSSAVSAPVHKESFN
jgi:NADH dehydrogenase [ubiquinone] 1 alpha subcomplex assembly factor 6